MNNPASRSSLRGFTLIELLIAVAVVAVLARLAYPSYISQVQKGVRRSAQAQMMDLANREQQYLLANRQYAAYSQLTQAGYSLPSELNGRYTPDIEIAASGVPAFTITFAATGSQLSDGSLKLTSEGVRTPSVKW